MAGSTKQINWAKDIINRAKKTWGGRNVPRAGKGRKFETVVREEKTAKFWINNKSLFQGF